MPDQDCCRSSADETMQQALAQQQTDMCNQIAQEVRTVTAQDELARANDNQIVALHRYNQARADFAHATGQMESLYAK